LIVDDYFLLDGCRRAVDDFRREHGVEEPLERIDWNGARWRRESEAQLPAKSASETRRSTGRVSSTRAVPERTDAPIPTDRELELGDKVAALEAGLRAVEGELEALRGSPLAGASAWARRRVKRGG
jgi:hypothetical protein